MMLIEWLESNPAILLGLLIGGFIAWLIMLLIAGITIYDFLRRK